MSFLFNLARDHFSRPKQPKQRSVQSSFDLTFHVKHFIDLQGEAQHRQRQAHHPVKQSAANKTLVVLTQQICFQLLCSTWNTDPQARAIKLNVSRETNRHIRSLLAFIERDIRTHWRKDILFHPPALFGKNATPQPFEFCSQRHCLKVCSLFLKLWFSVYPAFAGFWYALRLYAPQFRKKLFHVKQPIQRPQE